MTPRELKLAAENAEIKGDMRAIGKAVVALLQKLGVTESEFSDENRAKAKIPKVAKNLTIMAMGDGFNSPEVTQLIAVYPVIQKYSSLVSEKPKQIESTQSMKLL